LHYIVRQEFEGDEAAEVHILGFIDHTHPTAPEFLDDAVVRDRLTYHEWPRNSACILGLSNREVNDGQRIG